MHVVVNGVGQVVVDHHLDVRDVCEKKGKEKAIGIPLFERNRVRRYCLILTKKNGGK